MCAFAASCSGPAGRDGLTAVDHSLHLERHLDQATLVDSDLPTDALPADAAAVTEWRFDEPQPEWRATTAFNPPYAAADLTATGEALRVTLAEATDVGPFLRGGIHVPLPAGDGNEWAEVVIRARAASGTSVELMGLGFNLREPSRTELPVRPPFEVGASETAVVRDGTVQTYRLRLAGMWDGPIRELCIYFGSDGEPGSIDILSVSLVPTAAIEWSFENQHTGWRPVSGRVRDWTAAPAIDAEPGRLHVALDGRNYIPAPATTEAYLYAPVPDLGRADWGELVVRARAEGALRRMRAVLNLRANAPPGDSLLVRADSLQRDEPWFPYALFLGGGPEVPVVADGSVRTYRLPLGSGLPEGDAVAWEGPIREIGLHLKSDRGDDTEGRLEVLSLMLVRGAAPFADSATGRRDIDRGGVLRPTLFTHAPSDLRWRVQVPDGGRLGVALSILDRRAPVAFTVAVSAASDSTVFRGLVDDEAAWHVRSVDLSGFAGQNVELSLRTESEHAGAIGFWGSPILSGRGSGAAAAGPNVIVYVIDGGGADLMSVYGYNRRTTPNLERLAAEGVVFDRAHSNSAWTKPSTMSFMTSLQHSALGGFRTWGDRIPDAATTMAERFHEAGYQTATFTFHPNAGRGSALNRGVDRFQDEARPGQEHNESSRFLQAEFWSWREAFPGSPYWSHFQVTDVHEPQIPVAPYRGLFVDDQQRELFRDWAGRIEQAGGWERAGRGEMSLAAHYRDAMERVGIDPVEFYGVQRGLYDETMAYTDHQLGRLVDRLKASGEWENTVLVVTADHGHPAGSHTRFGRELFDPPPPDTEGAFLDSYRTRVPLVFLAPGRLPAGVRIREPVSLVDLLPTLLDLAGLPPLERTQGRSLVPLMRSDPDWETRPVILEQVERDVHTDELTGHIEMIDGRWGASLEIWPERAPGEPPVEPARWEAKARFHVDGAPRLLLYDLWEDPFTRRNVNGRYPELAEKYTRLLEAQWQAHLAMAALYERGDAVELSAEQLETLRSLGYIR